MQLFTFVFYALAIVGLGLHEKRKPCDKANRGVESRERRFVKTWFAVLLLSASALSLLSGSPFLYVPIMLNFIVWTCLGFFFTAMAVAIGIRTRTVKSPGRRLSREG